MLRRLIVSITSRSENKLHIYISKKHSTLNKCHLINNNNSLCKFKYLNSSAILFKTYNLDISNQYTGTLSSLNFDTSFSTMSSMPFCVDYDKRGQAKCKRCKQKLEKGELRIGKVAPNPFSDSGGDMKQWHHVNCIFESFKKARATTKKIDDPIDDLDGWGDLTDDDKQIIQGKIDEYLSSSNKTPTKSPAPKKAKQTPTPKKLDTSKTSSPQVKKTTPSKNATTAKSFTPTGHKDDLFREFRRLCVVVAEVSSYLAKTEKIAAFLTKGTSNDKFQGDIKLWVRLLLPGVIKRVYNLQSKQLVKLFSQIFDTNQDEMLEHLEQGDVAETIREFFEQSTSLPPVKKSSLSIHDVNDFLDELAGVTKEEEQIIVLKKICRRTTGNDLKMVIRLVKGDLRINAGAKHILDAIHTDAYAAFQTTRNIDAVIDQILEAKNNGGNVESLKIKAQVMTPVLPMLAEACKSVEYAMKKCPNGMFSEIKYDGERVQVHKKGDQFQYYSRSLKPVLPHKVSHFKDYIPQAFPHGNDLILDAEVLLIDQNTGDPLPFGTLGKHKKSEFQDANVCLFIFDCIHYNGENLMDRPICERKKILEKNMIEIKNHIMFSEMKLINKSSDLQNMITKVLRQGLEGLVLKDVKSVYEPGKRHWLKVKKDYLHDGAMADTADLVVLGAWYGTGKKGGMMSVFLMGCFDQTRKKWCSVTKVHTGHDDATLEGLQESLDMVKINQDYENVPSWLDLNKPLTPDFVCRDPKRAPVWEITGAEFTKNKGHTADGISIRFPRVTKIRGDKTWETATNLQELQLLYKNSKDFTNMDIIEHNNDDDDDNSSNGKSGSPKSSNSPTKQSPSPSKKKKIEENQKPLTNYFKKSPEKKSDKEKPTSLKRSLDDSETSESPKKLCKYGSSCYNNDENHLQKYKHKEKTEKQLTSNTLPAIFSGVKLYLSEKLKNSSELKRYFIAYDGELLDNFQKNTASYNIMTSTNDKSTDQEGHMKDVDVDWLWDSIKLGSLQSVSLYFI